jgi:AraC-like DNA-binding protein
MDRNDTRQQNYMQAQLRFCKGYVYLIIAYILTQVAMIEPSFRDATFLKVIGLLLIIQIASIIAIRIIPYRWLKPLSVVYHHVNTVAVCTAVILLKTSVIPALLWVLIIILTVYILHPWKKAVYWYVYIVALISLTFIFLYFIANTNFLSIIDNLILVPLKIGLKYIFGFNVLFFALLIYFHFLYYLNKLQKLRPEAFPDPAGKEPKGTSAAPKSIPADWNEAKYKEMYRRIEAHFDSIKPYLNQDFTINQLAVALNTNTTYISKAININRGINFNIYTNQYRITKVKEMLQDNSARYTLAYIAFVCGFKNQSTFNKAFREIEGITPTAYCKNQNRPVS